MQKNNQARSVLFRAQLGEEPIPTPEMIEQARIDLAHDATACAALAKFAGVIAAAEPRPDEKWRNRLQAYITAQLAGHPNMTEFADVQQALDRSVALAEEYELLYTVMTHEAQGALPASPQLPPLRLDFLPTTARQPTPAQKHTVRTRRAYRLGLVAGFPNLLPTDWFGRLAGVATLLILVCALLGGFWLTRQAPLASTAADSTTSTEQTQTGQATFFDQQMQLEDTPSPLFTSWQTEPENKDVYTCLAARQIGQIRRGCPL
jgi:hypothetical protein